MKHYSMISYSWWNLSHIDLNIKITNKMQFKITVSCDAEVGFTEADTTGSSYSLSGRLSGFIHLLTDLMFYLHLVCFSVSQVALTVYPKALEVKMGN